jgi:farnesyl diphosphate synthase
MFKDRLQGHTARVEACMKDLFKDLGDGKLADAMRYGALSGGKRLRAFLVLEGADLYRVPLANADRVAAAVECMHAYSLIHDDLPSMDDDDLRRGLPTVHKKWDEATAVLAGDALQTMAFEILASPRTSTDADWCSWGVRYGAWAGTGYCSGNRDSAFDAGTDH